MTATTKRPYWIVEPAAVEDERFWELARECRDWKILDFPDWVPGELLLTVREFWSSNYGRTPAGWVAGAEGYNDAPPFGCVVMLKEAAGHDWHTGRFVPCWNNIGRVVDRHGVVQCVSYISPDVPFPPTDEGQGLLFAGADGALARKFWKFHRENPQVYLALKGMALKLQKAGVKSWGIGNLFERLRYDYAIKTRGDNFILNNNHRAFFARLLMREVPSLEDFFRTRDSEADGTV